MPRETFFNLPEDKRNVIISAAMDEFSKTDYRSASTNQICKKAGIPKGSLYQYFTDKLDLYVYIMFLAIEEKVKFFSSALEEFSVLTLADQLRLLFTKGMEFAQKHPLYAALGEQFSRETDESVKSAIIKEGDKQAESLFMQMIQNAKEKGEIDDKTDSVALCLLLKSLNGAVSEYMLNRSGNDGYEYCEEAFYTLVDSLLRIIFNGVSRKAY